MSDEISRKLTSDEVSDAEDGALEDLLAEYSVDEVSELIEAIIADKSRRKGKRRALVARVMACQPHPVKELSEFEKWDGSLTHKEILVAAMCSGALASITLFYAIHFFATGGITGASVWTVISLMFIALIVRLMMEYRWTISSSYGKRAEMSLLEARADDLREGREFLDKTRVELEQKYEGVSAPSVSLADVKQEFADAQARIASYETDIDKALKYPAFNNISVREVSEMILQLKKCCRQLDGIDNGAHTSSAVSGLADAVDELWVRILAAEEISKSIGWSEQSLAEQKDLKLAQDLLAHINDATYSEDVRGGFFAQLKRVVDRLNSSRDVVPGKVVAEIETKARKEIESDEHTAGTEVPEAEVVSSLR